MKFLWYQVNSCVKLWHFGLSGSIYFDGLLLLVCGDFLQLPQVKGSPVYSSSKSIRGLVVLKIRKKFRMVELAEVMREIT